MNRYKTWVEISKSALKNNVNAVRKVLKPGTEIMAVVKSNAYGHGPETAGLFLRYGADWLGTDNIDEAISLRSGGIKKPILVLGYTPPNRFKEAMADDIRLTVYDSGFLNHRPKSISPDAVGSGSRQNRQDNKLHLKIDTGMSRQGILASELPKFIKQLPKNFKFDGVFSHFANADDLSDRSYPNFQLAEFKKSLEVLSLAGVGTGIRHMSATTGLFTMPEGHFDMVRTGVALYGLWPSLMFSKKFNDVGIRPALSWKTRVVQVKNIKKGTPVGYGATEKVKKDSKIAVLPVGYYDGYNRNLSSVGVVLVGGKRCKVLGRMSMNLMVIDVTNTRNAKVWDEAVLIGRQGMEQITAEELAELSKTISYEIVSRINPLLSRTYTQ